MASGGSDGKWILWDAISNKVNFQRQEHEDQVTAVAISPDSELLATGSADRTFKFGAQRMPLWLAANLRTKEIYRYCFSPHKPH